MSHAGLVKSSEHVATNFSYARGFQEQDCLKILYLAINVMTYYTRFCSLELDVVFEEQKLSIFRQGVLNESSVYVNFRLET